MGRSTEPLAAGASPKKDRAGRRAARGKVWAGLTQSDGASVLRHLIRGSSETGPQGSWRVTARTLKTAGIVGSPPQASRQSLGLVMLTHAWTSSKGGHLSRAAVQAPGWGARPGGSRVPRAQRSPAWLGGGVCFSVDGCTHTLERCLASGGTLLAGWLGPVEGFQAASRLRGMFKGREWCSGLAETGVGRAGGGTWLGLPPAPPRLPAALLGPLLCWEQK